MANIVCNTSYYSVDGSKWVLKLIEDAPQGINIITNMEISPPGFSISYRQGGLMSVQDLMSSSMKFSAILMNSDLPILSDIIMSSQGEYNLIAALYREAAEGVEVLEWAGVVHPEEFTQQISSEKTVCDFVASCGLASLKGVDFKDENGDIYTGYKTYEEIFRIILSKLPSWSLIFDEIGGNLYFREIDLPLPKGDAFSYDDSDSSLDKWKVRAEDFYRRVERTEFRAELGERNLPRRTDFVSCYSVMQDCLSALNISLCLSYSTWTFFSKESIANNPTPKQIGWIYNDGAPFALSPTSVFIERDINEEGGWFWADGAVRRGLYPINSSTQQRVNSGPDLVYASGMGWNTGESPLYLNADSFPLPTQEFSFKGESPMPLSGKIDNIIIPNLENDGKIRFRIGGKCVHSFAFTGNTIFRFRFQVSDGTNTWRLRRLVRTLNYTSTGTPFSVDVDGAADLRPKFYENYSWVRDDESDYGVAFIEYMIGSDPNILVEGNTTPFLTDDFPDVDFYTPVGTKLQNNSTNVLVNAESGAGSPDYSRYDFTFRIDEVFETPSSLADGLGGNITSLTITQWSLKSSKTSSVYHSYYNSNGDVVTITSLSDGDNDVYDLDPNFFQLNAAAVWGNDGVTGSSKMAITYTDEANGSEVLSLQTTSVGSSYTNLSAGSNGRLWGVTPSSSIEDNVKVVPKYELTEEYDDSLEYCTSMACKLFRKTSHTVNGSIFRNKSTNRFVAPIYPWQRFAYKGLNGDGVTEYFMPMSLSISLTDRQQTIEAIRVGVEKVIKPTDGKIYDYDSIERLPSNKSADDSIVKAAASKANLVQTTSPITDADLGGGTAEIDQLFPIFMSRNPV